MTTGITATRNVTMLSFSETVNLDEILSLLAIADYKTIVEKYPTHWLGEILKGKDFYRAITFGIPLNELSILRNEFNRLKQEGFVNELLGSLLLLGPKHSVDPQLIHKIDQMFIGMRGKQTNISMLNFHLVCSMDSRLAFQRLHEVNKETLNLFNIFAVSDDFIELADRMAKLTGRKYVVGHGINGHIAIHLALKCEEAYGSSSIEGIASGDGASLYSVDEEAEEKMGRGIEFKEGDMVYLLSGNTPSNYLFDIGSEAVSKKAGALYFSNEASFSKETQTLFPSGVALYQVMLAPPAFGNSFCFDLATWKILTFGALCFAADCFNKDMPFNIVSRSLNIFSKSLLEAYEKFAKKQAQMATIARLLIETLNAPQSDFGKHHALHGKGYTTFLATANTLHVATMVSSGLPSNYSTVPPRRAYESHLRRPDFSTYLVGCNDNLIAWETVAGQGGAAKEGASAYILADGVRGLDSYEERPKGRGNIVIGLAKEGAKDLDALADALEQAQKQGATTIFIGISSQKFDSEEFLFCDQFLCLDGIPEGPLEIGHTAVLKTVLDDILNATMGGLGKIWRNELLDRDVTSGNPKVYHQSFRLLQDLMVVHSKEAKLIRESTLFNYYNFVCERFVEEREKGNSPPPVLKTVFVMIEKKMSYEDAVTFLETNSIEKEISL